MGVEVMVTVGGGTAEKDYVLNVDMPLVHTLNNDSWGLGIDIYATSMMLVLTGHI